MNVQHKPDNDEFEGYDRRHPLTEHELRWIKEQIKHDLYAEIGQGFTKKFLWIIGAALASALAWIISGGKTH